MKKIHIGLIVVISVLLIGSICYGGLALYANQNILPKGVMLSGWDIGGRPAREVLNELDERLKAMESIQVQFFGDHLNGEEETLSLREAGVKYEANDFRSAVSKFTEGDLWERALYRYQFEKIWSIYPDWDLDTLKKRFHTEWEKDRFGEPVNAVRSITGDIVRYIPEQTTFRIDWTALSDRFGAAIPSDFSVLQSDPPEIIMVELPLTLLVPDVTVKSLQAEGIERKIIQFSTQLGASGPGRVHNITAAAKAVNGMILKPGDEFNYAEVVERARQKFGFKQAPVIVSGKLVPGIGGGICQVSSTVYNAVLLTGLEVTERRSHSLPVNYLPKGQDATFAEGYINFRFRNNTGKHLLIHAEVTGRTLTLKFFGTFPKDTVYSLESKIVQGIPAPLKYVRDGSLSPGKHRVLQNGKPGYVVETYRIKKVNGKVTERIRISRDIYRGQSTIVGMNPSNGELPGARDLPKAPVVEDGVSNP
ncbi:Vancomycin resistance protein YoaR, contains peptidoglycan-binding and VanW domains [Paenibacillus uliginis N3/975]|uniref:Vancomycin resistance protein YoaR, contains peptidoglycan-binding and VanW domains n=1 Tax=Paenibacillus uliginis N3/975 TaxID=1313296 RepID=A0A1X7GES7_9BACL|nr:VanW family protein [Paenibacillus uliginis]SMF67921.1 Vancomycin resistance protein YoaR, contains peptidoglycan-binding and VanW domains [Paenibacillus uliginis N3/975]